MHAVHEPDNKDVVGYQVGENRALNVCFISLVALFQSQGTKGLRPILLLKLLSFLAILNKRLCGRRESSYKNFTNTIARVSWKRLYFSHFPVYESHPYLEFQRIIFIHFRVKFFFFKKKWIPEGINCYGYMFTSKSNTTRYCMWRTLCYF